MKSSAYGNVQNIFLVLLSENKISVNFSVFCFFFHNFLAFLTLLIPYICCVYFPHFVSTLHCCKYLTFCFYFTLLYILSFISFRQISNKKEAPYGESVSEPFFHKVLLQFTSCFSSYSDLQPSKSLSLNKS